MDIPNYKEICAELRHLCFRRTYDGQNGGVRLVTYELVMPDRELDVQLWGDGLFRMSVHVRGSSDIHPEVFTDVEGLHQALEKQSQRTDSKLFGVEYWKAIYPQRHGIFY